MGQGGGEIWVYTQLGKSITKIRWARGTEGEPAEWKETWGGVGCGNRTTAKHNKGVGK